MKPTIALLLFSLASFGQTRISQAQYSTPPANEEAGWCPGPILTVNDSKTLTIGATWSEANPCYIHMDVMLNVDPLTVTKFTAPAVVHMDPGFTGDDNLLVWVSGPVVGQGNPVPVALSFGLRSQAVAAPTITCDPSSSTGCAVTVDAGTAPRMFPPNAVAVGFVPIIGGAFHPKPQSILGSHQIYIAGTTPMQVIPVGNGFVFTVNGAQQTAAQVAQLYQQFRGSAQAMLQQYAQGLEVDLRRKMPAMADDILAYENRLAILDVRVAQFAARQPPTPSEVNEFRQQIHNAEMASQSIMRNLQETVMATARQPGGYGINQPDTFRRPMPANATAACQTGTWAFDQARLERWDCSDGTWYRVKLERAAPPAAGTEPTWAFVGPPRPPDVPVAPQTVTARR